MPTLLRIARIFFAVDLIGFAIQLLLAGQFATLLPPIPPAFHTGHLQVDVIAVLLGFLAVGILFERAAPICALLIGLFYTGSAIVLHGHAGESLLHSPALRTGLMEALCIGAGALALFAIEARPSRAFLEAQAAIGWLALLSFALSLIVFGYQHFEVVGFVAAEVPKWIPQPVLMAQLTGIALVAGGIGLLLPRVAVPAGIALGIMFLLWALMVHLPRILAAPHSRYEWTNGIMALAMADAAWIIACGRARRPAGR